jgi:hypothetical protein
MRHPLALSLTLAALLGSCSSDASGPLIQTSSSLTITIEKASYTWDEVHVGSGPGVRGTITNVSDRTFTARLGDGFAGEEQDLLYVANGSDGALERAEGSAWIAVSGAQLIEGVRQVTLRPGRTYGFIAQPSGEKRTGTYRIVVTFRDGEEHRVISQTFEVR